MTGSLFTSEVMQSAAEKAESQEVKPEVAQDVPVMSVEGDQVG